ncbi:flagellar hook-basal body complex protein, partial [bacterium]|nr:flagellar hook-basal body complex protein [bacterium]
DVISVGNGTPPDTTITFDSSWDLSAFAAAVEGALDPGGADLTVSVNSDGSLAFSNAAGGALQDITVTLSAAGRTVFNSLAASIPVIDGTGTARTQATLVDRTLTNGTSFQNLNDLAAAVQGVLRLGSSTATVQFAGGRFSYDNTSPGAGQSDLADLTITRAGASSYFADAMGLTGTDLNIGETMQSDLLLDTADASDALVDLHDAQGTHLGLQTGDIFTLDALVGGSPLSQTTLSVVNTGDGSDTDRSVQTLGGLLSEMEDVLDLRTAGGVELVDGAIRITGRSGLAGELTGVSFQELNNTALGAAMAFSETQGATDVTHEASIRIFDSLGNSHLLSMVFTKDNDTTNRWTWDVSYDGGQVTSGGSGAVTFFGDGSLESFTTDDGQPLSIDPSTGANGPLVVDFHAGARGGTDGITGFARESTTAIVDQDGYGMGTLESISVGADGIISGVFTNGTSRSLAQMALANFNNTTGLERDGSSGWIDTPNSGEAIIRRPGTGSQGGAISSGTLEMSNVDIAQEFTSMIVAQRGFQANARTITTSDEMLTELVNLKR